MPYITLFTAIAIASVAAAYSIAGLVAIFPTAVIPVIVMGVSLEVGKLVAASWLHRNWRETPFLLKSYLTSAVVVLMLITSMGIFGFLSKAHIEQTITQGGNNVLQLEQIERRIARQEKIVFDSELVIKQLDDAVATLVEYDRIRGDEGALAVRQSQKSERETLNLRIDEAYENINKLQTQAAPLREDQLSLEAEVGPIKYIAELIYSEEAEAPLESAVRVVILLLVFVFDPLAVCLLLAANRSFDLKTKRRMEFFDDGFLRVDPNDVAQGFESPEEEVEKFYEADEDDIDDIYDEVHDEILDTHGTSRRRSPYEKQHDINRKYVHKR